MDSDRKLAASLPSAPALAPPPLPPVSGPSNTFPRARPIHGRTSGPTRRSTRGQWTPEEDEILRKAVERFKGKNWKKIAECFKDRTDVQCLHRWQKVLNPDLIKGPWSKEEDEVIVQLVNKYGPKKWSTIAQHLPGRIGKQCRERWHNHLNPSINKEAWTQEEELVLIRAHQIHGNKWAELTKYMPGRTDNAIKNHWNSSVKKKLESYITSGLLAQQQGLPLVSHYNQPMPTASLRVQQSSGEGSFFQDGADAEEISECSQVGCSQTVSDLSNTVCDTREDYLLSEESDHAKVQNCSPTASCSKQQYTSVDDITFTVPYMPCEFCCSSTYLEEILSRDPGCASRDCNSVAINLPNMSLELAAHSFGVPRNYFVGDSNQNLAPGPSHQSTECSAAACVDNLGTNIDVMGQMPRVEEGCSQVMLSQEEGDRCPLANVKSCSDIIDMDRYREYVSLQTIYQLSESGGTTALQPYDPSSVYMLEASNSDHLSCIPSEVSVGNGLMMSEKELSQINDNLAVSQGQELVGTVEEGYVRAHESTSPCHDHIDVEYSEQTNVMDSSRLVPLNTFSSETSGNQQTDAPKVEPLENSTSEQEAGTLCYEPPRFPSLDVPFFSCDLAQSGTDAQQDFSPLGIRRLMLSSASSLSPFKLWDSPSSDDSPDAVLKSAAKTFACTPSILKKRHRDLASPLSPFSERQCHKKTGHDASQGFLCTSRLTKEFSRLDVMFDKTDQNKESASPCNSQDQQASIEDKENICPAFEGQSEEANNSVDPENGSSEETHKKDSISLEKEETQVPGTSRGVLVERHLNDVPFSSPDGIRPKAELTKSSRASEVDSSRNPANEVCISQSFADKAGCILSPPSFGQMNRTNESASSSSSQTVSAITSGMVDSLVNEVGIENLNIFGGTPFRRSIESPSAWKSPWYFSSLVSGPRVDTDISIEDFGIFMSPRERSFDAIGLMKQINEQGAGAYADAREVLGSETPESLLKQRSRHRNPEGESDYISDNQLGGHLLMASNAPVERRVLDFSECSTPAKSMEKGKGVSAANYMSPSCLLKSCR